MPKPRWKSHHLFVPGMTPQEVYDLTKKWDFPVTQWETDLCKELDALTPVNCKMISPEIIKKMRMQPRECHYNVHWYVTNDPTKSSNMVVGWLLLDDAYILHSVVERDGELFCITPTRDIDEMNFRRDPKIVIDAPLHRFLRDGQEIKQNVRRDPADILRAVRRRLVELQLDFGCK